MTGGAAAHVGSDAGGSEQAPWAERTRWAERSVVVDDGEVAAARRVPPRHARGWAAVGGGLAVVALFGILGAAVLPWSGGRNLPSARALAAAHTTALLLLLVLAGAVVLGVLGLLRPRRAVHGWGALAALAGAGLSGWAFAALPADSAIGSGPGVAALAALLLAACQIAAARPSEAAPLRPWRRGGIAAALAVATVAALVLVGAGVGAAALSAGLNVDATTGAASKSTVDHKGAALSVRWARSGSVYGVAGDSAVVRGGSTRAGAPLTGLAVLDLATGAERWHHYERGWTVLDLGATEDGASALAVVDSVDGLDAVSFDLRTGVERWRHRLAAARDCPAGPDRIAPIGPCTGPTTTVPAGLAAPGSLVVGNGLLYASATPPAVDYLDGTSGRTWTLPLAPGCGPVGVTGDRAGEYVYLRCAFGGSVTGERVLAMDRTGRTLWSTVLSIGPDDLALAAGALIPGQGVLVVERSSRNVVLDAATGGALWNTANGFDVASATADGNGLAWTTRYTASMFDARTGVQRWGVPVPGAGSVPVLGGGRLYLLTAPSLGGRRCDEPAGLTVLDEATGRLSATLTSLPEGIATSCTGEDYLRGWVVGSLLVLTSDEASAALEAR